jgi:hypothetical protein
MSFNNSLFTEQEDGKVYFYEQNDALWWSYRETKYLKSGEEQVYKAKGKVPKKLINQGQAAIRQYAKQRAYLAIQRAKERRTDLDNFLSAPNFPVQFTYKGVVLKGKIDFASHRYIHVVLESPLKGESGINFGLASAFAGHFVIENDTFSNAAIEAAQRLLVQIYRYQKRNLNLDQYSQLAQQLNEVGE